MTEDLANKVVLITGAASGIGQAAAVLMARHGARLILSDSSDTVKSLARDLGTSNSSHHSFLADVRDPHAMRQAVGIAVTHFGRLDCAVNNAGIEIESGALQWSIDTAQAVLDVNLTGVLLSMKHELDQMYRQRSGSIVNLGSVASNVALPGKPGYVASKHAVIGLTKSAALQYGQHGIRVNAVCPGPTRTPMFDRNVGTSAEIEQSVSELTALRRLAEPAEIAEAICWLCSHRSSYVTGQALYVDGGYTLS